MKLPSGAVPEYLENGGDLKRRGFKCPSWHYYGWNYREVESSSRQILAATRFAASQSAPGRAAVIPLCVLREVARTAV